MIFLRPWFLLLILIPFLFKLFKEHTGAESPWKKVIDEKLLPYLLIKGSNATTKQRRFFKTLLWILLSVAMAGPSWDKVEVPAHTYQPGTIIVMELGPTMTGANLKRAQQKIYDILDLLKGEQVGLVLYDRYGYTAGPLTFETDIIRNMVPYLNASVLPETKSNPIAGFEQANKLFENANIEEGRILFLTTGVYLDDDLAEVIQNTPHKVGILGIGPAEPHPIPRETGGFITMSDGQPLMVYFDQKKLREWGAFEIMTADDTDVQNLIDDTIPKSSETERLTNQNLTIWRDRGGVLVAFLLPFFALLFRKSIIILLLLCLVRPAEASLWLRPDQEEYHQQMNGVSFYRKSEYVRAEKIFKKGKDVEALYNKGNALAFQQKIPEAIAAYKEALKIDPKHEDARYNKEYLEKQQKKQQEKQEEKNKNDKNNKSENDKNNKSQNDKKNSDKKTPPQQDKKQNSLNNPPEPPKQEPPEPDSPNPQDPPKKKPPVNPEQPPEPPMQEPPVNPEQPPEPPMQEPPVNPEQPPEPPMQEPPVNPEQPPEPPMQEPPEENSDQNPPPPEKHELPPPKNSKIPPKSQQGEAGEDEIEPVFDQESEKILNQLPPDEDNVLRYRIRQQYKRYRRK